MQTIGIITVHHYHNYGSALQAYATQAVFEKLGYETFIIDYRSPEIFYATDQFICHDAPNDSKYRKIEARKKRKHPKQLLIKTLRLFRIPTLLYRLFRFKIGIDLYTIWMKNLNLTKRYRSLKKLYSHPPLFDIYIAGSDQIWNTYITYNNPAYFLTFAPHDRKKIAFATSIGIPFIPQKAISDFKESVATLSSVMLREQESVQYLSSLGIAAELVLDPTLLLTRNEWAAKFDSKYKIPFPKYIFAYFLQPTEWTMQLLKSVQQQSGLPVIYVGDIQPQTDNIHCTKAIEVASFLTLLDKCDIVVTNSFHGMAFALNFNKTLVSTYRSNESDTSMNSRHRNLIELFGIERHTYFEDNFKQENLLLEMDFKKINKEMERLRKNSVELLQNAIRK